MILQDIAERQVAVNAILREWKYGHLKHMDECAIEIIINSLYLHKKIGKECYDLLKANEFDEAELQRLKYSLPYLYQYIKIPEDDIKMILNSITGYLCERIPSYQDYLVGERDECEEVKEEDSEICELYVMKNCPERTLRLKNLIRKIEEMIEADKARAKSCPPINPFVQEAGKVSFFCEPKAL
ncbi:MAG TPA: hypothetical protein DEF42_15815 [Desulfosporosinus sp.]|nr:hypothetical protein [Desulfosporosinus sp.]